MPCTSVMVTLPPPLPVPPPLLSPLPHALAASRAAAPTAHQVRTRMASPITLPVRDGRDAARPAVLGGAGPASGLVQVDRGDEHRADDHLLPERSDAEDLEAVLQHRGDEHADDRAQDAADAAEQAGAADHHR